MENFIFSYRVELTKKKNFCDQFWKKFCDFYEEFT